jgi:hypothetical protein
MFLGRPLHTKSERGEELLRRLEGLRKALKETQLRIEDLRKVMNSREEPESILTNKNVGKPTPPGCPHYFGYLKPTKNVKIDDVCLTCPKLIECIKEENISMTDKAV